MYILSENGRIIMKSMSKMKLLIYFITLLLFFLCDKEILSYNEFVSFQILSILGIHKKMSDMNKFQ